MQVNFETLLDSAQHLLVPVNLQIRMQTALHQHTRAAKLDRLANFLVNSIEVEDVSFLRLWPLQWTIKRAECAIFSAEIRVINIAINDVGDHAFGMQCAANSVGFHADADEIVGAVEIEGLGVGQGHEGVF